MKKLQKIAIILGLVVLLASACIPSGEQIDEILSAAEQTAMAQITFVPVTYTPDVNIIVAQTFAAMTAQAVVTSSPAVDVATSTYTLVPTITVTLTPVPGSVSGTLSYPSSFIPPLRVVAYNANGFFYRYVDTMQNQGSYQITGLVPGLYHIVAYVLDGSYAGGFTQAVPCGLSFECADHSLIDVVVEAGKDTPNINPGDWYAPEGIFPPMPLP
jgi:hypothetical protein